MQKAIIHKQSPLDLMRGLVGQKNIPIVDSNNEGASSDNPFLAILRLNDQNTDEKVFVELKT